MSKADARLELLTVVRKLRSLSQRKYYLKRLLGDRAHKYTFTDEQWQSAVPHRKATAKLGKAKQGQGAVVRINAKQRRGRARRC